MRGRIREALRETEKAWRRDRPEVDAGANAVFIRLGVLSRQLAAFHERVLKPEGVSATDYQLLAALWVLGSQTPTGLNELMMMTTAGLTNALDRLEEAGTVRRRRHPEDARSVLIQLTAAGSRLAERLSLLEMEAQARALRESSRGEVRDLAASLDDLIDKL